MPGKYKLTYFDGRGLAEPIRYLLMFSGEDFEDNRLSMEEWPKYKSSTPFGKLPTLEIDGNVFTQSGAIYRYLGKKGNLAGNNDLENLHIDIIADVMVDLRTVHIQAFWEGDEETKKEKKEMFIKETLPFYMQKLEEVAKNNNGYLANKKLSWADIMFASLAENISLTLPSVENFIEEYSTLKALKEKILSDSKIKPYVEKRKIMSF
uniref:glutathione transferase n=1 Tax=Clastoptera arizonana TaxID=38151 RepID=A0A1B6DY59_9HEMI